MCSTVSKRMIYPDFERSLVLPGIDAVYLVVDDHFPCHPPSLQSLSDLHQAPFSLCYLACLPVEFPSLLGFLHLWKYLLVFYKSKIHGQLPYWVASSPETMQEIRCHQCSGQHKGFSRASHFRRLLSCISRRPTWGSNHLMKHQRTDQ